jgi:H+/Cl- antiporter ClcA
MASADPSRKRPASVPTRCERCGLPLGASTMCAWCGHDRADADSAHALAQERHRLLTLRRDAGARREWLDEHGHEAFATGPSCGQWTRMGLCEWCDFNIADAVAVAALAAHRQAGKGSRNDRGAFAPGGPAAAFEVDIAPAPAGRSERHYMTCPSCAQWSLAPVCVWCGYDSADHDGYVHLVAHHDRTWTHRRARLYSSMRALVQFDLREQADLIAHLVKWIALGVIVGVLAGLSSAGFLFTLDHVTEFRVDHPWLLWLLPVAGLVVGMTYHYLGGTAGGGNNLILDEIHEPRTWVPKRMAVLVYLGTEITHLFGGSAGREGTAIQMAGSLTDGASRVLRVNREDRRIMLIAALAGGFGAVFGVPIAGCVFGLEVQSIGRLRYDALVPALTAPLVGDLVVRGLGVHHTATPDLGTIHLTVELVAKVALAGLAFGLTALVFAELTHGLKRVFTANVTWPPLRPFIGGMTVVGLSYLVGTRDYNGLSVPLITRSLAGGAGVIAFAFALKLVFTAITLGSGFQGGEVTPLFVIGATLGVALGHLLGVPVEIMASVGFVAVFAGAANVPLACTVMGAELFGADGLVLYAVACVVAYVFSSHRGIYTSQRLATAKGAAGTAHPADGYDTVHALGRHRRHWLPSRPVPGPVAPNAER